MTSQKRKIAIRILSFLLMLVLLFIVLNVVALWYTYPYYRMTFGAYNLVRNEWENTQMQTCIMTGNVGLPLTGRLFDDFFSRGYLVINNTTYAQHEEYFKTYGEGSQILLNIEQDDRHVRMEYIGYGMLPDGTKEPVHDVFDFTAPWPWIMLGAMPELTRS